MRGHGPAAARTALALLATAALTIGLLPPATAAPAPALTYPGPAYTTQVVRPPTGTGNQSKLWFHANAWWALLLEPTGRTIRVHELMPDHTWRPTTAVVNPDAGDVGDAFHDGDTVHVVSRPSDGSLTYSRLSFDAATREYIPGPSALISLRGPRAPATIAKDTTGRLWVSYGTADELMVSYSDDGAIWSTTNAMGEIGTAASPESAALVAYDDRIGILWSDQWTGSFEFASHRDGDSPFVWTRETAGAGPPGGEHLSLRRVDGDAGDTLVAAVTMAGGTAGESAEAPRIQVLVRAPGGTWSAVPVSTMADGLTNPVLQVDAATRTVHVFATAGDDVVSKQASLDDLRFDPGLGRLFMMGAVGRFVDPTVAKDPVDARSGQVVLASDTGNLTYGHAEAPIASSTLVADPADVLPPNAPGLLQAKAESSESVALTWAEVTDPTLWSPGRSGVPAREYVVLRDGVEIGTVTTTSFRDQLAADTASATTLEYQVLAVDSSGNRSAPSSVVVDPSSAPPPRPESSIGIWLLVLAGVATCIALYRPVTGALASRRRPRSALGG
jgi:hypothetical protein